MLPWSEARSGEAVSGESGLALKNSASAFFAGAEVSLSTAFWYSVTASSHRPALKYSLPPALSSVQLATRFLTGAPSSPSSSSLSLMRRSQAQRLLGWC